MQASSKSTLKRSAPRYKAALGQGSFWVPELLFRKARTAWQQDYQVLWQEQGLCVFPKNNF